MWTETQPPGGRHEAETRARRDEATPGQTDRLAIPRGGGHRAGPELRGVVPAGHGPGCRQGWEETLQSPGQGGADNPVTGKAAQEVEM